MKNKNLLAGIVVLAILLTISLSVWTTHSSMQTLPDEKNSADAASRPNPTGDGTAPAAAAGYVSGVFRALPGQSVRVSAVNAGKKAVSLEIVFIPVSEQGKAGVSVLCDATPAPGDAAIEKITIPDGTSNRLMYVQIRVENANDLKDLAPSLEVFNEQTGPGSGPHFFLGGNGFAEIRPIWVPS